MFQIKTDKQEKKYPSLYSACPGPFLAQFLSVFSYLPLSAADSSPAKVPFSPARLQGVIPYLQTVKLLGGALPVARSPLRCTPPLGPARR
jgi:hypothetical protein